MLCDVCKCNDATVFLTQILEGKMHKVNLCEACSKEKGVQDPTSFALADLLLGLGATDELEKGAATQKCPSCGFSQADFKKTGRLGCSECYVTFVEGLSSLLKAMHKGTESAQSSFPRLGEESGAQFDPGTGQAACGRAPGNAGIVLRKFAGSFGVGSAGVGGAAPD